MTIDQELVFAETQALTASANTAGKNLGAGALEAKAAFIRATIKTAGAGTGTVQLAVEGSDDNSSFTRLSTSPAVVASELAAGDKLKVPIPPSEYAYLRAAVVVTGTVSAGAALIDIEVG